jgi:hypothetical protein
MRADSVEVSWDMDKKKWLVRIQSGDEVLLRHCAAARDVDEQTLRSAAQKTVQDEGYEPAAKAITIHR